MYCLGAAYGNVVARGRGNGWGDRKGALGHSEPIGRITAAVR
jgi:hypothetical protein